MKVSAVGFLFQNKVKTSNGKGRNYTCIIHKINPDGTYNRNTISSPLIKENSLDIVSNDVARFDITNALNSMSSKNSNSKFIGATVKDGVKETEIHSIFSDKLFAVRTRDDAGKNHFKVLGKNKTQKVLSNNIDIRI